jgi:hypothetical protein
MVGQTEDEETDGKGDEELEQVQLWVLGGKG